MAQMRNTDLQDMTDVDESLTDLANSFLADSDNEGDNEDVEMSASSESSSSSSSSSSSVKKRKAEKLSNLDEDIDQGAPTKKTKLTSSTDNDADMKDVVNEESQYREYLIELHKACLSKKKLTSDKIEKIKQVIEWIYNYDKKDQSFSTLDTMYDSETLLAPAAENGHTEIVRKLLESGASPDARETEHDETALMRSANVEITKALIEYKASVNLEDGDGFSALEKAIRGDQSKSALELLRAGATILTINNGNNHNILRELILEVEDEELLLKLIEAAMKESDSGKYGDIDCIYQTALQNACIDNWITVVEKLLNVGINKETALFNVLDKKHFAFAKMIIDAGAQIIRTDAEGNKIAEIYNDDKRSLIEMALNNHAPISITRLLLERGAGIAPTHDFHNKFANYCESQDQRDPDVLFSLRKLHEQEANEYYEVLDQLTIKIGLILNSLASEALVTLFSMPLIRIICGYDNPLEHLPSLSQLPQGMLLFGNLCTEQQWQKSFEAKLTSTDIRLHHKTNS